jgi:hypothetical protein
MFDANLQHDLITGRLAMGTFHMVQNTVVHFSSKRQSTVETAMYATEFIAGRTCFDEAIPIRYELQMLGTPLDGPVWMFCDNKSMIDSLSEPSGRLAKGHLILLWHHLQEKAAMKIVHYVHIDSNENVSDCLTKHLPHPQLWALIKEHLFHRWDGRKVTTVAMIPVGYAPDRECQARNGIGPEQVILAHEGWWNPVFIRHSLMVLVMISRRCLMIPVTCEHLDLHVGSKGDCTQHGGSKADWTM